jgi:hypothetical protein
MIKERSSKLEEGKSRTIWRRWAILLLLACLLAGGVLYGGRTSAQSGQPGTAEDPIITKSYLDQFLTPQVVELPAGHSIIGQAGTQFILRVGSAYCVADPTTTMGGLSDVTGGIDVKHQEPVQSNHLLIVPRSDGRGLLAQTDIVLLVWGLYQRPGD